MSYQTANLQELLFFVASFVLLTGKQIQVKGRMPRLVKGEVKVVWNYEGPHQALHCNILSIYPMKILVLSGVTWNSTEKQEITALYHGIASPIYKGAEE